VFFLTNYSSLYCLLFYYVIEVNDVAITRICNYIAHVNYLQLIVTMCKNWNN